MSTRRSRLASFFVAPAASAPATSAPAFAPPAAPEPVLGSGRPPSRPSPSSRSARRAARPAVPAVGIVGDRDSAPFAVDLACALAARARDRCGVAAVWGAPAPVPPRGHPTRAAALIAAALASACPGLDALAGGRGVVVALPSDPEAAAAAYDIVIATVGGEAAGVLALCGPRPGAFDEVLARQAVIVLALATGAPPGLAGLAAAALTDVAPEGKLTTVTPASGNGLPRPLRHRAAIRHVLETMG
jgi:hypothetical protein